MAETARVYLKLQGKKRDGILDLYCSNFLSVNDSLFIELIKKCFLDDEFDIFHALVTGKWHYPFDELHYKRLMIQTVLATLQAGRQSWLDPVSVTLGASDFANYVVSAAWQSQKFEFLHDYMAQPKDRTQIFTYGMFRHLLLTLDERNLEDFLRCFDTLLVNAQSGVIWWERKMHPMCPSEYNPFEYTKRRVRPWLQCCRRLNFYHAFVYISLIVHEFTDMFNIIQEQCFTDTPDQRKLRFFTLLCAYPGIQLDACAVILKNLAVLYERNGCLDNLFLTLADVLLPNEWNSVCFHLVNWCRQRNLMHFEALLYNYARDMQELSKCVNSIESPDHAFFVLSKMTYNSFRFLLTTETRLVIRLLEITSNKDVILGCIFLRAVLNRDLADFHRDLTSCPTFDFVAVCGHLDPDLLRPLLLAEVQSGQGCPSFYRDKAVQLIRSGLGHRYGQWLETVQLPQCRARGCPGCEHCTDKMLRRKDLLFPNVFLLLASAGILPNRLLQRLRSLVPRANYWNLVDILGHFGKRPLSLQTQCLASISVRVGSQNGRRGRITDLCLPNFIEQIQAFEHEPYVLASERRIARSQAGIRGQILHYIHRHWQ